MFVSIDPGEDTGWALWNTTGLVSCGLGDPRRYPACVKDVWIEDQQIIPRVTKRPADILKLAQGAGIWAGRYDAIGTAYHFVGPNVWKGGPVPKKISHPRILAALAQWERYIVAVCCCGMAEGKRHNVLDAVGIGQWVRKTQGIK